MSRGNEISFSQLLSEVEAGNVQDVTIAGNTDHRPFHRRPQFPDLCAERSQPGRQAEPEGREDHRQAVRGRRAVAARRAGVVVPHAAADRRVDLLHAPDAVGRRTRHGLRQVQGEAAHRAARPRDLRRRGRRRRGQGRSAGDRRVPARSRRNSRSSAGASRAARCWSGLPAPARRCSRAPSPARPTCRSSPSPAPTSSRCSSASARRACATCSIRRRRTRPASSSSTRSTRSAAIAAPASAAATTSASRR